MVRDRDGGCGTGARPGCQPADPGTLTCGYHFYVPNGWGDANVYVGYTTANGTRNIWRVQENGFSGWWTLGTVTGAIHDVSFQDNTGESGSMIGWGTAGFAQNCWY